MVLVVELSDNTMGIVHIVYIRDNQVLRAVEYHDALTDDTCLIKDTALPSFIAQFARQNKYEFAFENLEHEIRACGERVCLDFNFQIYNGPIGFIYRQLNIDQMIFRGNATPQLINDWHYETSFYPVRDLTIVIKRGETMRGLGQLEAVKNAEVLTIIGDGSSDITDQEMQTFDCELFNIKSINLTAAGVRSYLERRDQRNQEQAVAAAAAVADNEIVINMILPRDGHAARARQEPEEQNADLVENFQNFGI